MGRKSAPARRAGHAPGRRGQAIILLALMAIVLFGALGLAIDSAAGYVYSVGASRAAAAGALSGVVFMPDQFDAPSAQPPGSGNDATERALAETKRNGYADGVNGVTVVVAKVPGFRYRLSVTVSKLVPVMFMQAVGGKPYTVSRTAIAEYHRPLQLGQPGNQLGSTLAQLGKSGYYFMQPLAWNDDRENGDPYSPNPAVEYSAPLVPSANDIHAISAAAGTEPSDPSLPDRGGYNFQVTIPAGGGIIQVYNAAPAPDWGPSGPNLCDNIQGYPPAYCSAGGSYYYREGTNGVNYADPTTFLSVKYTVFKVTNTFVRSDDKKFSQMRILPVDARNWNLSPPTYSAVNTGLPITQLYNLDGTPANMKIYHSWVDIANYQGLTDGGVVSLSQYFPADGSWTGGALPAGTYRLRVDTLNNDGSISGPGSTPVGPHSFAVRLVLPDGVTACGSCTVGGWGDMVFKTPISGGSFTMPLFQVPPDYAGETVTIDIFDPGDISGVGDVTMSILDPSGAVATNPAGIKIYDMGVDRSTPPGTLISTQPDPTKASFVSTLAGTRYYNGHWVHFDLPIPAGYSPGPSWWWQLQYTTGVSTVADDTVTIAVSLKGDPVHLLQS